MFFQDESQKYEVTPEQNEQINNAVRNIVTSIKNEPQFDRKLQDKYNLDVEIFFDPEHEKFESLYAVPDMQKDNILKMITLKSLSKMVYGVTVWGIYSISRFALKRYGFFPTYMKYTRFASIPVFGLYSALVYKQYMQNHIDVGLAEYKQRRINFDKHTKIMKDILRAKTELAERKTQYEEGSVNVRKLLDNQGK